MRDAHTTGETAASPASSKDEERNYYALAKRVYDLFAPFYDLVAFPLRNVRRTVAAIAGVDVRSRVLDVATGTGSQARAFADKGAEVIGIDLSEPMLRVARRKHRASNLTFRQADATALPLDNATFDVSCVSFALHEMPASIRRRAIAEMVRVTKPGGTVMVVDYGRPPGAFGTALFHLVRVFEREHYVDFVRSDLRAFLERSGIDVRDDRSVLRGAVRIVTGARSPIRGTDGSGHPTL